MNLLAYIHKRYTQLTANNITTTTLAKNKIK